MNTIWIVLPILTVLMLVIISAQFSRRSPIFDETTYDVSSGWLTEDGKSVSMSELPAGKITITHSLSEMEIIDKILCIKSSDTFLDVSVEGVSCASQKVEYLSGCISVKLFKIDYDRLSASQIVNQSGAFIEACRFDDNQFECICN